MLYINGKFLTQRITGVQRVGVELVKELDKLVKPGEVEILSPPGRITEINLNNIKITEIGNKANNFWVQWTFPKYVQSHKGESLTLSGLCPVIKPGFFLVHDATFRRHPESFRFSFRLIYNAVYTLTLRRCKHLFTVSEFSKHEMAELYGVDQGRVTVLYNSSQQLLSEPYKNVSLEKWGLKENEYYLSVSSKNAHKNQNYIIQIAKKYPQLTFVIAGGSVPKSFNFIEFEHLNNIVLTGYLSDEELYNVYKKAKGFIFPSLYEGFGIPPLEAITLGVKHIAVSDIPVFREVYSQGVYFFDPNDISDFDIEKLDFSELSNNDFAFYLNKYSWKKGARTLLNTIQHNVES